MARKKNLERAIVLGLMLSTGVYGTAWAEITGQFYVRPDADSSTYIPIPESYLNKKIEGSTDGKEYAYGVLITSEYEKYNYKKINVDWKLNSLNIDITKLDESSKTKNNNYYIAGIMTDGVDDEKTANLILTTNGITNNGITNNGINVKVNSQNNYAAVGVWAQSNDSIKLTSNTGDVTINVNKTGGYNLSYINDGEPNITQTEDRKLHAVYGLNASSNPQNSSEQGGAIEVITKNGSISVTAKNKSEALTGSHVYAAANDNGHLILSAGQGADYTGTGSISLKAESNRNNNVYGLDTWGGEENRLTADEIFISAKAENGNAYGVKLNGGTTENYYDSEYNEITGESINGEAYGVLIEGNSSINIHGGDNFISGAAVASPEKGFGIKAINSDAFIKGDNNYFNVDSNTGAYISNGQGFAVSIENTTGIEEQQYHEIAILANESNIFSGAVYAKGNGASVKIEGEGNNVVTNNFYSASVIEGAGGLGAESKIKQVVSSLYAESGANISVSGVNNIQTYYADPSDNTTSERAVWAYDGGDITINGATNISTTLYDESPNSMDIAIAAGTAPDLGEEYFTKDKLESLDISYANLNYENYNGAKSYIKGDILAAYGGEVNILPNGANTKAVSDAGIDIYGNLLAGNNGVLNVNLGNGGTLTGRADDYGDAGVITNSGHGTTANGEGETFFDPAFSSEIQKGGVVNLTMGEDSRWNVTGQSWITSINTENSSNAVIDLISANTDRNKTVHALTVYNFKGDATFNMSLDADRSVSDMLYMKKANGDYVINVVDPVTVADMYAEGLNGLRFATVGSGKATFRAVTLDQGAFNLEYAVDTDDYANNDENVHYNGEEMDHYKPGDSMVDGFFDVNNDAEPGDPIEVSGQSAATMSANADYGIMLLDEPVPNADNEDAKFAGVKNSKLVGISNAELSPAGQAILNMSRANYSNAIYMDRLNKRLGEARYINGEENEGMWVRIRHDRIGKEDAYRSQNTMYELGYDVKQECDNGERRVGFAVDYMHGDTGYSDIAGKGEIDRYGLWLYDTWMGDKGHYVDYVAKWGHLDNDFEIYAPTTHKRIDGDYSNNVFSVSAEYGRKKDIGSDWYFEPQAQLQLARVTGAEYTTSQDTKVSVDGINSLIGRAGFRIGKDFGEQKQSTVYIKADVLHEFLGDQDISVMDGTTNGEWAGISYENEGTWYDVGFGFATMMSKNSYAFLDLEKSFGHDNDETYQINVGMQWSF